MGLGRGRGATLNIPLAEGLSDAQFIRVVKRSQTLFSVAQIMGRVTIGASP